VSGLSVAVKCAGIVETGTRVREGCSYPVRGSNHDRLAFAISAADRPELAMEQASNAAKTIEIKAMTRVKV